MDIVREGTHPITCVGLLPSNPSANRFPHQLSQRRAENKHLGSRSSSKQRSSGRRCCAIRFFSPRKGFYVPAAARDSLLRAGGISRDGIVHLTTLERAGGAAFA